MSLPTTTASVEADCREFARQYPTPNVVRAIALAEAGRVSWVKLERLFAASLADGIAAVSR